MYQHQQSATVHVHKRANTGISKAVDGILDDFFLPNVWANEKILKLTHAPGIELGTSRLRGRQSRSKIRLHFFYSFIFICMVHKGTCSHEIPNSHMLFIDIPPQKPMFSRVCLNQPVWPSVRVSIYVSVCVLNTSFCQKVINPFPNKPLFLHVCSTSLLKTLGENEKLLLFSLCFLPFLRTFCHFNQIFNCRLQT